MQLAICIFKASLSQEQRSYLLVRFGPKINPAALCSWLFVFSKRVFLRNSAAISWCSWQDWEVELYNHLGILYENGLFPVISNQKPTAI